MPDVVFFDSKAEPRLELLGGKCASLVSMTSAGMPVPPGFAVTTEAYDAFVEQSGLRSQIRQCLAEVDPDDIECIDRCSAQVREQIERRPVPEQVSREVEQAYARLQETIGTNSPVAVRSSATAEDLPGASFAGQQDTYLWLTGFPAVGEHIRKCWASLYTSRAIIYRLKNGIGEDDLSMAVAVQKMVRSRVSGVAMTLDAATGDRSKITIDASYGVGELVVSGRVTPDNLLLDKVMLTVVRERIGDKHVELVPDTEAEALVERPVPVPRRAARCLDDDELARVALMAKRAEKHYGCPQDVEWAFDADLPRGADLLLLQSRPETVHSHPAAAGAAKSTTGPAITTTAHSPASSITAGLLHLRH